MFKLGAVEHSELSIQMSTPFIYSRLPTAYASLLFIVLTSFSLSFYFAICNNDKHRN